MRFRKLQDEETRLSIAPLIDVVFLLLIFFMVTSHFDVASGVRIQLPKVVKKIYTERSNKVTLTIDKSGNIYFEGKKMDLETLGKTLKDLSLKKGPFHLVLHADKDVKHGRVVEVMDIAKTNGVHSIIIAARWKAEKLL